MRPCSVDGCEHVLRSRGYCSKHYNSKRSDGTLEIKFPRYRSPVEAFEARTEQQGECLVWISKTGDLDYGRLWVGGRDVLAHRYSYERTYGKIPRGMTIDHKCRNLRCVEPTHLRQVSHAENMQHLVARSTSVSGVRGVHWHKGAGKWVVKVTLQGNSIYGGYHESLEDATEAAIALRSLLMPYSSQDPKPTERGFTLLRNRSRLDIDKMRSNNSAR